MVVTNDGPLERLVAGLRATVSRWLGLDLLAYEGDL